MTQLSLDLDLHIKKNLKKSDTQDFKVINSVLLFLNSHKDFQALLNTLSLKQLWEDCPEMFVQALTHTSFYYELTTWPFSHLERLEFLGDAALDFYVSKKLILTYKLSAEGDLSKLRSAIVNEAELAQFARLLGIDRIVLIGKGEAAKSDITDAILSDVFEAMIGFISLKASSEELERILDLWVERYDEQTVISLFDIRRIEQFDPKTSLQEKTLAIYKLLPTYEAQEVEGGHFKVDIYLKSQKIASHTSTSKKKAQVGAAKLALENQTYILNDTGV